MYVYKVENEKLQLDENDLVLDVYAKNLDEVFYWRKHPAIHDWMSDLYYKRGGTGEFNGVAIILKKEDIHQLKEDITNFNLNYDASGFFFGKSIHPKSQEYEDDHLNDLEFIEKCLDIFEKEPHNAILYDSSW